MQKAMECMYKLIFIAGLVCASGFSPLRGADHGAAVNDFQRKVANFASRAGEYKEEFDALRSKSERNNFLTPDLHDIAGDLLENFTAERVKGFRLPPYEQKEIIRAIFSRLNIFKPRSKNAAYDKPARIRESIRYELVKYCFDAFSFDDAESEEKNEVGFIVCEFLNLYKPFARASSFLLTAMNDCLSRSKDCPTKGDALVFCSKYLGEIDKHRNACSKRLRVEGGGLSSPVPRVDSASELGGDSLFSMPPLKAEEDEEIDPSLGNLDRNKKRAREETAAP